MLNVNFDGQVLYLEGDLQVHHLENIKEEMVGFAALTDPLIVDMSLVSEIDLAGLQLVLALMRSRKSGSRLEGIGPHLDKAMNISGLNPHFAKYLHVARS